jgi:ABC-type dipeptide/oligopeptide/nickel transport system, ATPase component
MSALLDVTDLAVSFRTRDGLVRAVDGVSLAVAEREILGVVGESGSGKSLTVLAVLDLIGDPNAVITGSIRFRGQELVGQAPETLRRLRGGADRDDFSGPDDRADPGVFDRGGRLPSRSGCIPICRAGRPRLGRWSCSMRWGCPIRRGLRPGIRWSFRAGSGNGR